MEETGNDSRNEHLYKYRSLSNPTRFIEILLNQRLHGAFFEELNDPMEGYFKYSEDIGGEIKEKLTETQRSTCICSLSRTNDKGVMWAHYADGHKGACIEVRVTSTNWKRVEIKYVGSPLCAQHDKSAEDLFNRKSLQWEYEKEIRYIKTARKTKNKEGVKSAYIRECLSISIERVYLGMNVSSQDFNFWRKLIKRILPNVDVVKMQQADIDFGYNITNKN